jgi:hypothetical protein
LATDRGPADCQSATQQIANLRYSVVTGQALVVRAAGGGFDEFPELGVLLQRLVFADGETRTEEEVLEAVLAQDAVDDDPEFVALKIDAVIPQTETVEELVVALQPAEALKIGAHHFLREAAKLTENLQLQLLGHLGEFGGAGGVKDDLEWAHESVIVVLD